MVYYHLDSVVRYVERLGYRDSRAIFNELVRVNVNGTLEDNSWYSPWERLLTFGLGAVDDAEDGETIIHEFAHALQDAICPDFGQTAEAAAMGTGTPGDQVLSLEQVELGERVARQLEGVGDRREMRVAGIKIAGRRRRPTGERPPLPIQLRASGRVWLAVGLSVLGIWASLFLWPETSNWCAGIVPS